MKSDTFSQPPFGRLCLKYRSRVLLESPFVFIDMIYVQGSAGLSIGRSGTRKGPDKLNFTRFSSYKFRSVSDKGAFRSSPRTQNELKPTLVQGLHY
ncbi:hypothetical protein TNCV_524981 [Trichonephila clavipes]|nr:hypothetical protein TNCV_524981 [Trichonephila clavipes]